MKIAYATAQGGTQALLNQLNVKEPLKILNGTEKIDDDFILFTYTTGRGETPQNVEEFVKNNSDKIKAVIGLGNLAFHADTFCFAADNIAKKYNVPILYKVDSSGEELDVKRIKLLLNKWLR